MDEALYLQRQQEMQRDFQIRQMLLQEQLDHQSRLDSMLHEHQLKAIEQLQDFPDLQHYSRYLINEQLQRQDERNLLRERAQLQHHEELRRRQVLAHNQPQQQLSNNSQQGQSQKSPSPPAQAATKPPVSAQAASQSALLRDLAADSLAGNAVKRSELEKRVFAKAEDADEPPVKKRPRSGTHNSVELENDRKQKGKKTKRSGKKLDKITESPKSNGALAEVATMKPSAQNLLDFATALEHTSPAKEPSPPLDDRKLPALPPPSMTPPPKISFGTLGDLLAAATAEKKTDDAVDVLVGIRRHVDWPDSEPEEQEEAAEEEEEEDAEAAEAVREMEIAVKKGDTIQLPGFTSILPQLPEEPELEEISEKKKKFKSILDDDSVDSKSTGKKATATKPAVTEAPAAVKKELAIVEYPYPIDTWWPSVTGIRRERKTAGEPQDEDAFDDDPEVPSPTSEFRANLDKIKDSFAKEVTPGSLEKIPHCKIHRMLMKKRKNPSAPELVFCFQVTELYPNDVMVCCSHCGTWRHTACGGHHKPYSIRECIDTPFNAVCDRCHEEEKILRDYPVARRRIERQRTEQIRRALSTSAAMRQASFSKHGGTYKWPLGSVSATHIGGHTRSVHSRHDKAEKQWTDMATRLARGGYKPKERVKVRTKELERLLVSVEDAGRFYFSFLPTFE
jgi:hypothetical protein